MKWKFLFLFGILYWGFVTLQAQTMMRNVAYEDEHIRFTVISSGVIRMEYAQDGHFVDEKSQIAINRFYPVVDYRLKTKGNWIELTTSKMKVRYRKNSGAFTERNLMITSENVFPSFIWIPGQNQHGNLRGTYRTLDGMDGNIQTQTWVTGLQRGDSLVLEDGLLATDGWTFIDDSYSYLFNNDEGWEWVKERSSVYKQDWYFMAYGHDYKSALKDYTLFAGKMPLPPRYAFGYWWSRYWPYSDKEFRQLVNNFHTYNIPLDVLVIDMDWHYTEEGKGGWTGWTWNRNLFPCPDLFLQYLKQQKLKVTLNLHPAGGVAAYEKKYSEVAGDMGVDTISRQIIPWISSDKRFMNSVFDHILEPMEKAGVDFWWLDWQQNLFDTKLKRLNNIWWINYAFFSRMERVRDTRPLLYHRWGGLGNHRYQVGFSGDAVISWRSLSYQPYFNTTASNVLYGYWSHDLGGHIGSQIDPEMYIRWLQFGAFSPIMRTHSQKSAGLNKEPWAFTREYGDIIRQTIRWRYVMAPYIYTMARKGYDEGISLCRPLYYDYPELSASYRFRNEYFWGDAMLVSPATDPMTDGFLKVSTWLPQGDWYEWSTGSQLIGGRVVERLFSLDEYPVYVKAGSILPFYDNDVMNLASNNETIVVTVFPGGHGVSTFDFYEDNGNDKNYASEYAVTRLQSYREGNRHLIVIGSRKGSYEGMPVSRSFKVKILSSPLPVRVCVDGEPVSYVYQGDDFSLVIDLPSSLCDKDRVVEIVYKSEVPNLDGLSGIVRRMAKTLEDLKYRDSYICLKEELGKMGSLSEAVMYCPQALDSLVADFWDRWSDLPQVLLRQGLKSEDRSWFLKSVGYSN